MLNTVLRAGMLLCGVSAAIFAATRSEANCLVSSPNERLSNFCMLERSDKAALSLRTVQVLDYRLKREGFSTGLGLKGRIKQTTFQPYLSPILKYSSNINGGNPEKPLVLGGNSFTGQPHLIKKKGVVIGAGIGTSGRSLYGRGKYFNMNIDASYAHSPAHHIGIATLSASACAKNYLKDLWHLDVCGSTQRTHKDITDQNSGHFSVSAVRLYTSAPFTHHHAAVGVKRYFANSYIQNQLTFGIETIHNSGLFSKISATLGEALENKLVTRKSLSGSLRMQAWGKPLTTSAGYSAAKGGKLFGVDWDEKTTSFNVTYQLFSSVTIGVGYSITDSTIDYYDVSEPNFKLRLTAIKL